MSDDDTKSHALVPQKHGGAIYQGRPPGFANPGTGRPPQLTDDILAQITNDITSGMYARIAAARAGISEQTYYKWLKIGQDEQNVEDSLYRKLVETNSIATAESEKTALDAITSRFTDDLKAPMWWLERRFPKRWGRQQRLEIAQAPDLDDEW